MRQRINIDYDIYTRGEDKTKIVDRVACRLRLGEGEGDPTETGRGQDETVESESPLRGHMHLIASVTPDGP